MGIRAFFDRLIGGDDNVTSRRKFLRAVATAAPAAVAAAAAIDLKFVPELKAAASEQLRKLDEMVEGDLGMTGGRIVVGAPRAIFDPALRVWRSVAAEAGAWADYVSKQTGVSRDRCLDQCMLLARLVDHDLRIAKVDTETKIDVQLPRVIRTWTNHYGAKHCEIGLGLHKEKLFDGSEQHVVKFAADAQLVNSSGRPFKTGPSAPVAPAHDWDTPRVEKNGSNSRVTYASLGPQEPIPVFKYEEPKPKLGTRI